jgi:hypothetical protein
MSRGPASNAAYIRIEMLYLVRLVQREEVLG